MSTEATGTGLGVTAPRKRVDEDWKRRAHEEKSRLEVKAGAATAGGKGARAPDRRFLAFLGGLVTEARIHLGEAPDPMTGARRMDLGHAQYLIEMLRMLQEKTRGNLSPEEDREFTAALVDLQMRFASAAGPGGTP